MASTLHYDCYVGIDYLGVQMSSSSLKGLRVYVANRTSPPLEVQPPKGLRKYWKLRGVAEWLAELLCGENLWRYMEPIEGQIEDIIRAVKEHRLEGLVAKRRDGKYEPGRRSGAWRKMRVDETPIHSSSVDTRLVVQHSMRWSSDSTIRELLYASRTRNGSNPASRPDLLKNEAV
jgi:ATP dependent DNA ligase domain